VEMVAEAAGVVVGAVAVSMEAEVTEEEKTKKAGMAAARVTGGAGRLAGWQEQWLR